MISIREQSLISIWSEQRLGGVYLCLYVFFVLVSKFVFVAVVDLDRRTVIDFRLGSAMRGMCVRAIRVKVNIL